ncbi:hypothetical protein HRR83_006304 [Exophiala dermatitidis]|uniref:Uncharacterized protein n=1 Tax=Exophiala dermatitidis TaxID=5970 RepID=A0AAN6EN67_EXODE|nr:hypothetical protein HRR76_008204 [Exophiala dermatitidis]KAJ4571801.1 hypothetical protein HRR82_007084 [Exophiala dermatitidis]KAJ4576243.1 hypothetical protein HRR81_004131 [Exophiala dermatitidis]KAJ4593445.1 hypothetical protein HRR83_006304 [Exophiala dermatitidis]KAJ4616367.1 hypothetical protein HRR85_003220 [Exophiala dermatitidis]
MLKDQVCGLRLLSVSWPGFTCAAAQHFDKPTFSSEEDGQMGATGRSKDALKFRDNSSSAVYLVPLTVEVASDFADCSLLSSVTCALEALFGGQYCMLTVTLHVDNHKGRGLSAE